MGQRHYSRPERMGILYNILKLTAPTYKNGKMVKGMNLVAACYESGTTHQTFSSWLRKDKEFSDIYENSKKWMTEVMRFQARSIVQDALMGHLKLKDKEKVDISLRFLEKTDEEFKERKEIEVTFDANEFGVTMEELEQKAQILISNYKTKNNGELISSTTGANSEPTSDGEDGEASEYSDFGGEDWIVFPEGSKGNLRKDKTDIAWELSDDYEWA